MAPGVTNPRCNRHVHGEGERGVRGVVAGCRGMQEVMLSHSPWWIVLGRSTSMETLEEALDEKAQVPEGKAAHFKSDSCIRPQGHPLLSRPGNLGSIPPCIP
eukprot:scaffold168482_cov22-Tisochrysis_lutea.AAC.1